MTSSKPTQRYHHFSGDEVYGILCDSPPERNELSIDGKRKHLNANPRCPECFCESNSVPELKEHFEKKLYCREPDKLRDRIRQILDETSQFVTPSEILGKINDADVEEKQVFRALKKHKDKEWKQHDSHHWKGINNKAKMIQRKWDDKDTFRLLVGKSISNRTFSVRRSQIKQLKANPRCPGCKHVFKSPDKLKEHLEPSEGCPS
ncbi:hypothetical protein EDB80DRAFT_742857 [Ilyonectria destructans]|nr:hypothetical protein EDB80DRAFT_742857 [Ilyonectria destructans]